MGAEDTTTSSHLVDRNPSLTAEEMVAQLVPPPQFESATLESYRPDSDYPSQSEAVEQMRAFRSEWSRRPAQRRLFSRRRSEPSLSAIYLDGGFGVGKTHLLAAAWFDAPRDKYYGTFIEYTALVGALGYSATVDLLRGASLVCIDEFELDDPGDTRLMARLLGDLAASGSRIAATSNTPPNALGEGRFASQDFLREIDSLAARFTTVRIDGLDYRRRDIDASAGTVTDVESRLADFPGATTVDEFELLVSHLAHVHPSRYVKLVQGIVAIGLRGVSALTHQTDALRFVAFVDRLYDEQVAIVASGVPLDQIFPEEMTSGGYGKKYLRAVSRMIALTGIDPT